MSGLRQSLRRAYATTVLAYAGGGFQHGSGCVAGESPQGRPGAHLRHAQLDEFPQVVRRGVTMLLRFSHWTLLAPTPVPPVFDAVEFLLTLLIRDTCRENKPRNLVNLSSQRHRMMSSIQSHLELLALSCPFLVRLLRTNPDLGENM